MAETRVEDVLRAFDGDPQAADGLAAFLGFSPIPHPTDLLGRGPSPLRQFFTTRTDQFDVRELYRVGGPPNPSAPVGLYVAVLEDWGVRSSDRDRARRRLARAVVEQNPAGDARSVLVLVSRCNDTPAARREAEFVFPRVGAGQRAGVTTIRALIDLHEPTRFHRDLLRDIAIPPGVSLLSISQQWQRQFSVERVTRQFYQEYAAVRDRVAAALLASNRQHPVVRTLTDAQRNAWATRQMGRLLFLWFLQAKRWLGYDGTGEGSPAYFRELWSRRHQAGGGFYRGMLRPLFFEAMARRQPGTAVRELVGFTPYLNGGLFRANALEDRIDDGGILSLPDAVFDPDDDGSVLNLLSRYRFTTRESTPDNQSVDPDPELLGRVFENLYQSDERQATGTYYTAREIVQFMCRQALDGYLRDTAEVDQATLDWLRREVTDPEGSGRNLDTRTEERLRDALETVRVCDPAVGSGAFLLGTMHEIVELRRGMLQARGAELHREGELTAQWKRRAIQWSLYGVDINPEAVEICQLRLWLSLVLDMENPQAEEPLPNLDFRIVAGDSLIDRAAGIPFAESLPRGSYQLPMGLSGRVSREERSIEQWRREFEATQDNAQRLRELRKSIAGAHQRIIRYHLETRLEDARETHREAEAAAAEKGAGTRDAQKRRSRGLPAAVARVAQLERLIGSLRPDAPFEKPFLWPVAFPEVFQHGGFDVVLANPPYVRQEHLAGEDQETYAAAFSEVFSSTADLFVYFYERAGQIARAGGWLSYITSDKFMRADYAAGLRRLLSTRLTIVDLIDFAHLPVFDADVMPAVLVMKNSTPAPGHGLRFARLREPIRISIISMRRPVNVESVRLELESLQTYLSESTIAGVTPNMLRDRAVWALAHPDLLGLYDKLKRSGRTLKSVLGSVDSTYGVKTGLNEAYILDNRECEELIRRHEASRDILVPWVRGRDIGRWMIHPHGLWVILLRSSNDPGSDNAWRDAPNERAAEEIFRRAYPAIHERMMHFKDFTSTRSQKPKGLVHRTDQGKFWWELRSCAYYSEFEKPKMVWRDIAYMPHFAWDDASHVYGNTAFFSCSAPKWLVAVCNSVPFAWIASMRLFEAKDAYYRWLPSDLAELPIPTVSPNEIERLTSLVDRSIRDGEEMATMRAINECCFDAYGISMDLRKLIESWYDMRVRSETVSSVLEQGDESA